MTDGLDGDWRILVEDEPIGPDNQLFTFHGGRVLDAAGDLAGTYQPADDGGYRIVIGDRACSVRVVGDGAIETLTGSADWGDWSDPVIFSRVRYDVRPPYGVD